MEDATREGAAQAFDHTVESYLDGLWRFDPVRASGAGLHEHDASVGARTRKALDDERERNRAALRAVEAIPGTQLDRFRAVDRELLLGRLRLTLLELDEIRLWEKDPGFYTEQMDVSGLLLRETAPLRDRVTAIAARLEAFPDLVTAGRSAISAPQAPFVRLAIQNLRGFVDFFRGELGDAVAGIDDRRLLARLARARERAAETIAAWAAELAADVLPRARDDFAVGESILARMLEFGEHVTTPLDELRRTAEHELARLEREIEDAARRLDPALTPAAAFARISSDHPPRDGLARTAAEQIEGLRGFVVERGIASVPEGRCVVREAPPFARWNPAYISTPGPFERRSLEGIYFIAPVEPTWPPEEQEAYLRANNLYALHNTTCHEVYPGHYLAMLALRAQPSKLQKVFYCYSAGEGWAHYAEQMLLDEGFADGDVRYRLEQLRDALLRAARFRVALGLHTEGWSVARAEQFFRERALQDPVSARQQAVRGTFDPGYLNYTLGKLAILKLRDDHRRERGVAWTPGSFHDEFLRLSLPIPLARRLLLQKDDGVLLPSA
jgi:uncharacterized protein (DUF885 family)